MQKAQAFKVKGMQRDASMANANEEFAYEIVNMRVMPAEEGVGFSLTNEKGALQIIQGIQGEILGQCPTTDSLIIFTKDTTFDYIYKIFKTSETEWDIETIYSGNLGFSLDHKIEALFNYETDDIQKVYWIDGINQLRCVNIANGSVKLNDDYQFDSVKEVNSLPEVSIERVSGGNFTAGVIQYYITYFNEFMTESPIIYTSPLLYIAHENRGAKTNDMVNIAFKITLKDLNHTNWNYIRIYATHRTSLEATPEASIVSEIKISDLRTVEFIDFGSSRTAIAPSDLYFIGGKFVKAGTMTVKDQVMFLGNLEIGTPDTIDHSAIQAVFDDLRNTDAGYFRCDTRKAKYNNLKEYEDTYYKYDNQLNNTESITHFKYGEKYRFGISVMDKWGNWSNPIWIKDAFIEVPPEQTDIDTLELPCPQLELGYIITSGQYAGKSLYEILFTDLGVVGIKPLAVYPDITERKVLAQGVVCPTVYNLKDRKENGPYAQASWFMRPNAPIDLWNNSGGTRYAESDAIDPGSIYGYNVYRPKSIINSRLDATDWLSTQMSLIYDDLSLYLYNGTVNPADYQAAIKTTTDPYILYDNGIGEDTVTKIIESGSWVEFRHNYALRTKGWTWGPTSDWYDWSFGIDDSNEWNHAKYPVVPAGGKYGDITPIYRTRGTELDTVPVDTNGVVALDSKDDPNEAIRKHRAIFYQFRAGGFRSAELDTSRFGATIPVNRFYGQDINRQTWRNVDIIKFNTGNSAYYVDNSIVTLNSPEIELTENLYNTSLEGYDFRIVGAIPLTATISDISLETKGNLYNPSSDTSISMGLKKTLVKNKNIGHHGFKGLVSHSSFYSGHNHPKNSYTFGDSGNNVQPETNHMYGGQYVASFPLHPWQATGNIPAFLPDFEDKNKYSSLLRKILSNLRYSASTKYLPSEVFTNTNVTTFEDLNAAVLNSSNTKIIGWKPKNGSSMQWYTSIDAAITRLNSFGYNKELVYSANIDSIALATAGDNADIPIPIYQYFAGRKLVPTPTLEYEYSPYHAGLMFRETEKAGIGSSIKYKSSPHAVISFNNIPVTLEDASKYTQEILPTFDHINMVGKSQSNIEVGVKLENAGVLYEDDNIISIPHQAHLNVEGLDGFGLPGYNDLDEYKNNPTYGWLWLGEIYKEADPTFGGDNEYALQNNKWEVAGGSRLGIPSTKIPGIVTYETGELETTYNVKYTNNSLQIISNDTSRNAISFYLDEPVALASIKEFMDDTTSDLLRSDYTTVIDSARSIGIKEALCNFKLIKNANFSKVDITITLPTELGFAIDNVFLIGIPVDIFREYILRWTQGDTYYQRFDTLKTYAYSDKDENSIVDITSFMVETRINIDGRTDRNRGQESNLQMSPENFNLVNDIYSQKDNFFTYRMLDDDVQKRTKFTNQITWSLSKTAGETIDKWLNVTLASVMDLDGTKGKITALKTFNNNIIAFQDTGISHILFNSRVQIPTSEYVPVQIANSGKVDGQQYFTTDLGCQDKWNIVTSPQGLYFVDYYNKSIYKFNGQIEDLSTTNGFRGWCDKNIDANSSIIGYYDKKNKEVMFYGDFEYINNLSTNWLGFSELTNVFSSFYTYPKAVLTSLKDEGIWLYNKKAYIHQAGEYSDLIGNTGNYGLTVIARKDSNLVKTFNTVEFRADTFINDENTNTQTFDTIKIEDEYNGAMSNHLEYNPFRPSNLKKLLRTWRANIPRVNKGYWRYTNQWAKVGLWMMNSDKEKTILHDLAVWYSV